MDSRTQDGTPVDPRGEEELDELWESFEESLTAYLAGMVDPEENDHLILELTDPEPDDSSGCAPYAQFAAFGEGQMVRAEVAGNARLRPQFRLDEDGCEFFCDMGWRGNDSDGSSETQNWFLERPLTHADEIANHVAWGLRYHFGIAHPHLLTYHAWGPAADGAAAVLGLCSAEDVPIDQPQAPAAHSALRGHESVLERLAITPTDRDDLLHIVESLLRQKYDSEPIQDEDGDFVLHHLDQPIWVRVRTEQPAVEIVARVAHDVHSRRATAVEISLLNRDNNWTHWTLIERSVWQTILLPAYPVVPRHLSALLDVFMDAMSRTRDDLAYRLRAKVA